MRFFGSCRRMRRLITIGGFCSFSCGSDDDSRDLHVWPRCGGKDQEGDNGKRHLSQKVGVGTQGRPGFMPRCSFASSCVKTLNVAFCCLIRRAKRKWWFRKDFLTNTGKQTAALRRNGRMNMWTTGRWRCSDRRWVKCRQLSLTELWCSLRESLCYSNTQPSALSLFCLLSCSSAENNLEVTFLAPKCFILVYISLYSMSSHQMHFILTASKWKNSKMTAPQR